MDGHEPTDRPSTGARPDGVLADRQLDPAESGGNARPSASNRQIAKGAELGSEPGAVCGLRYMARGRGLGAP
jgi:hypothetical protein